MIAVALFALVMGMTASAYAVTLSFVDKGNGVVDINVDQAQGIAGAAFTVTFDTTKLTLTDVTSTFFETFTTQKTKAGSTWTSAIPTAAELGGYDQPLLHNNITTGTTTGVAIAAARFKGADAATNATLFTLSFTKKTGVTETSFPLSIIATTLSNTNAGYSASGETINLLVGADHTKAVTDAAAFPVILAKSTSAAASGNVNIADPGTPITVTLSLNAGWNMVSLPVTPTNASLTALFPDAIIAYKYENGYKIATTLEPGLGYWIKVPSAKTYPITGTPFKTYTRSLAPGWYMMGAVNGTSTPSTDVSGAVTIIYEYSGGYKIASQHALGKGYWVKIKSQCNFTVTTP